MEPLPKIFTPLPLRPPISASPKASLFCQVEETGSIFLRPSGTLMKYAPLSEVVLSQ